MKKLIIAVLSITTLGLSGTAVANGANSGAQMNTGGSLATETVNDIPIPTDVLIYAQTHYQGYAVTQASKATRNGQQVYRLRVDPNNVTTDYDGFYLLYDTNWKLLGEEKMTPPPAPQPKQQTSNEKVPGSEKPRTETQNRKPKKPRHGN